MSDTSVTAQDFVNDAERVLAATPRAQYKNVRAEFMKQAALSFSPDIVKEIDDALLDELPTTLSAA